MAGRQITSRLKPEVKSRFTEYAAEFGFSDSELAKLLLLRESAKAVAGRSFDGSFGTINGPGFLQIQTAYHHSPLLVRCSD